MTKRIRGALLLAILTATAPAPLLAQTDASHRRAAAKSKELFGVSLPAEEFTLPNGLRVIVHTDHTTPVVAVNVWYHVGSRHEVSGKTGFAHLFEHLMFNGSENYRDEFFRPFDLVGRSALNGSTSQDRTNYYETIPTPALDLALWMESDRMGHLLGAIDQKTLDEQRGVVQNEKRQRYGQPYALVWDRLFGALFPNGHPYHHTPIGSMADLDAASLDDVKAWFKSWYGPNNAVLVLAGDVDLVTAKAKVTRYFGDIAPSGSVPAMRVDVPVLAKNSQELFPDKVPQAAIYRAWPIAEGRNPDAVPLQMLAKILGGSGSSRLQARLVQREQVAVGVRADVLPMELAGMFVVQIQLKDGIDQAKVEAMIDQELTRLVDQGPTAAEVEQARSAIVATYINALPQITTRAELLNECTTYSGRPDCWKDDLRAISAATPASLRLVARRWLTRGSHTINVVKSDVAAASLPEAAEKSVTRVPMAIPAPDTRYRALPPSGVNRSDGPPKVTGFPDFNLPPFRRATLSNGMQVVLAERHAAPVLTMLVRFPSGSTVADLEAGGAPGRAESAMQMLVRGAGAYPGLKLIARMEALGASILPGATNDDAAFMINSLKINLPQTLDLFADMLLRPEFDGAELDRFKEQSVAGIRQQKSTADQATSRVLSPLLYGDGKPLGRLLGEDDIAALTRDDLIAYMRDRFDPSTAQIVIAGDTTLAEIVPLLEARIGAWKGSGKITVPVVADTPLPTNPRIFLIDQPGVPQSTIRIAQLVGKAENNMDSDALDVAVSALGGGFTSRLNMDLREDKHWSYGASAQLGGFGDRQRRWIASAPVQTDRTADAMRAMWEQINKLDTGSAPVTVSEIEKSRAALYGLAGTFQTNLFVASGISGILTRGWPDDYYSQYAQRIRAMTPQHASEAFAKTMSPNAFTWVVMGDLSKIEAPIRALNLGEVTVIDADGKRIR